MDRKCCDSNKNRPVNLNQACCSNKIEETSVNNITEISQCCSNKTKELEESVSCCCNHEKGTNETTNEEESSNQHHNVINMPTEKIKTNQSKKIEYHINGMDCPSCASTIEKGLNELDNIQEAKVHYNTAKLQVFGSSALDSEPIENTVQQLGFSIEPAKQHTQSRTYNIVGMDCGSCAKSIESHLNTFSAVHSVQVHFSTGKMKVDHENSVDNIISEVSKLGYQATLLTGNDHSAETKKNKDGYGLIILSGILIAVGFIGSYWMLPSLLSTLLYAAAIVISGYKPVKSAYFSVKARSLDMNVLMSAAAIGAALIGEWFEGATVVWLFALGTTLQNKSIEQTRKSISNLMEIAPAEAWVKEGKELVKKPVEAISIGTTAVIKPGERVPLDGKVIQGETSINQAPITGESIPVDKQTDDIVYAGTINENGSIEIEVTKLAEDTTLSQIIHLVEEAQEQKAPAQAFIDKFAGIYTPIVFALAIAVIVLPPLVGLGTWGEWTYKGLALLIVACPCALVISTPVAIVSAIGNAAKNGVLIKGGTFLEKAGAIKTIAFDKTGTLTEGKPKVSEVLALSVSENELLSLAFTLENYATHPIAKTITEYAKSQGIPSKQGALFKNLTGKGVQATIDNDIYYAGNLKLFEQMDISLGSVKSKIEALQGQGKTVVIIGTEEKILGVITVADTIRTTTARALNKLQQIDVNQLVMLTGDNEGTAKEISNHTTINRYFADLMPEDKVTVVKQLQNEGREVAMVGDGINDAPALATADLGIAMGGAGTDTAMETADIVLMADNLEKLPHTMKLSKKALAIIKQNIWFSIIIKLAAFLLIFPGMLTLWMAVLSDTGAAVIVILNALRLLKVNE